MRAKEARALGDQIAARVRNGKPEAAYGLLAPVLAERTPFRLLDLVGAAVGREALEQVNDFLDRIATERTEGGWVVIASALREQLERDPEGAFDRCRGYVVAADVWYGADILGERVPGPALVADFRSALNRLSPWRQDGNAWVRRTVGVAVHFWAKRSRGATDLRPSAQALLAFLEPMFDEWEMAAVKGVGWGLKTLGKHYSDLVADWLANEVVPEERKHRALMLRKATTYLSDDQRQWITAS